MTQDINNLGKINKKIFLFKQTAYVTGGFALLIMLLLIINFIQLKSTDPLESKSLKNLLSQYDDDSKNEELKEEIRSLDLLARKAFFTKEWQLKTGSYLLLAFVAISLFSFRMVSSLKFKLEMPDDKKKESEWQLKTQARNSMVYIGIFLAGLVFVVYFFSDREFDKYLKKNLSHVPDSTETKTTDSSLTVKVNIPEPLQDSSELTQKAELASVDTTNSLTTETTDNTEPAQVISDKDPLKLNHIAFRGYGGLGVSYCKKIPTSWDGKSGKNIKWKSATPRPGYSSPIIWGDLIFLTGGDNTAREVYCFNRKTGKIVWTTLVADIAGSPSAPPKVSDDTGLAAPTMTTDGKYVYAIFATGDIICLDMKGKKKWAKNLGVPKNHYGFSSSLINYKNLLYIQYDDKTSGKLIGLDTQTGNEIFRTKRTSGVSWTSPILIQRAGQMELVIDSDPGVAAYDAITGKEKWKVDCLSGEIGSSPVFNGKYVFAANEYAKLVAIEPGDNARIVWEGYDYLPEVSSPVSNNKFILTATSSGSVGCFDANTGKILWNQDFENGFYSSPIIADGKIYLTDMQGTTYIIKESSDYELIAKASLGEKVVCTPAFADGYIYIRGVNYLYCISNSK
jgi:outer membrane protein assembly factor BamB